MEKFLIQDYLKEIGVNIENICLGDFDIIGEYTAKKNRSAESKLYREVGCFFRPNYERGILLCELIKKHKIESILEIGFGRGYSSFCMAKTLCDENIDGKITTVDPNLDKNFLEQLGRIFPKEWFDKIDFVKSTSDEFFRLKNRSFFDLIYIDGDHRYEAVKNDWEYSKNIFKKIVVFDDYHLPTKKQKDIECARVVDAIEGYEKKLIITDRRIFFDDRRYSDDEIDYGQVLITRGHE